MKRTILAMVIVFFMLFALISVGQAQETAKKIRVGVYDNRAIAFAYFGSAYNPFEKRMEEYKEAKADGDSARIKELEAWGPRFQRQLQFQGFCRAPVDDLLLLVKDKLAEVAGKTGVDLIGWYPDYLGAEVEIVDITVELVALFKPSQESLEQIAGINEWEPTALWDMTDED